MGHYQEEVLAHSFDMQIQKRRSIWTIGIKMNSMGGLI